LKQRFGIVIILAIFMSFSVVALAGLRCHYCGKEISGVYYTTSDGKIYCDACWTSHPICSICGQLVNSVTKIDGHNYCPSCYAKIDKCSLCGKPLVGTYTQYPGLNIKVCPQCEREKPRCDKCGVPSNELIKIGQVSLCPRCVGNTERCHSCGAPLLSDYSFFEGNKSLKYCFECVKRYPRCEDCGAPSGPDGTKLDDGRYLCPDCRKVAYFDAGLIESIRKKVIDYASGNMGITVSHDIKFSLQDRDFLTKKAKDIHGDLKGLFYRKGDDYHIYILYGLREKDLIGVIAHEMTHAWQAENSVKDIPLEDQEGFAQWVAYKALIFFGDDEYAKIMTDGDDVYAKGLTKILNIEKLYGSVAVYKFARTGQI
jgi:hypothetical protein